MIYLLEIYLFDEPGFGAIQKYIYIYIFPGLFPRILFDAHNIGHHHLGRISLGSLLDSLPISTLLEHAGHACTKESSIQPRILEIRICKRQTLGGSKSPNDNMIFGSSKLAYGESPLLCRPTHNILSHVQPNRRHRGWCSQGQRLQRICNSAMTSQVAGLDKCVRQLSVIQDPKSFSLCSKPAMHDRSGYCKHERFVGGQPADDFETISSAICRVRSTTRKA